MASVVDRAHLAGLVHPLTLRVLAHAAAWERALVVRAHRDLLQLEVQRLAQTAAHRLDATAGTDAAWWQLAFRAAGVALDVLLALILGVDVGVDALAGPSLVSDALVVVRRVLRMDAPGWTRRA